MATTDFATGTVIAKAWLNDADFLIYDIFNGISAIPSAGKMFRSNGTHVVPTTFTMPDTYTIGDLLYASAANVLSSLAKSNTAVLVTDSSGVPSWDTGGLNIDHGGTGQITANLGFNALAPTTTKGDIIVSTGSVNARQAVGTDGYSLLGQSGATNGVQYLPVGYGYTLINGDLSFTVGSSALTVAIKGWDGNDPSATNPVYVAIRSATAATSLPTVLTLTGATSVVVSSGSTLGTNSSVPFRIWVVGFNDAGTFRLGVINCINQGSSGGSGRDVGAFYPLSGWAIASSTAEGGAGGADSSVTFYTGSAVTSKGYTVIGYATWETGLGTAGTWSAGPTRSQLFAPSITPLPGTQIQISRQENGGSVTGTTLIPFDDTIPQSGEGDQYIAQSITPVSAANILSVYAQGFTSITIGANITTYALFQDSNANALKATSVHNSQANAVTLFTLSSLQLSGTTSSTTFKLRAGSNTASTLTWIGSASSRIFGGIGNGVMEIRELMG